MQYLSSKLFTFVAVMINISMSSACLNVYNTCIMFLHRSMVNC